MDPVLSIAILTVCAGAFGILVRYTFRSKCEHLSLCCGLVKVDRNVLAENEEEKMEIENGIKQDTSNDLANIMKK